MVYEGNEWKLDVAKRLKGQALRLKRYTQWSPSWDHDHCAACWAEFAERDAPDILHEGYATTDSYDKGADYEWVCVECFDELKDDLGWTVEP